MAKTIKDLAKEFIEKTQKEILDELSDIYRTMNVCDKYVFRKNHDYLMQYFVDKGLLKIIGGKEPQKIFLYKFTTLGKKVIDVNNRRVNYIMTYKVGLPKGIRRPKKGKPGKYDGNAERLTKYPYDLMTEPGWSFHVPETYENPKPAERIGPSVAAINKFSRNKYGQLKRRFVWRKVDGSDPGGHGVRVWRVQ